MVLFGVATFVMGVGGPPGRMAPGPVVRQGLDDGGARRGSVGPAGGAQGPEEAGDHDSGDRAPRGGRSRRRPGDGVLRARGRGREAGGLTAGTGSRGRRDRDPLVCATGRGTVARRGGSVRDRAETVIVGAGIVGASAAYHLAELGVTDVLVIDQGPLFETGGSTSHAPGIVFQTNGSRTMCRVAQDSVSLYDALDLDGERVWYPVGGLEVATTPERVEELKRRQGFARSYGIEGTELLSPAGCAEKSPLLDHRDGARRLLGPVRRRRQGRPDRERARATCAAGRHRVRGRGHGHGVRRPGRPRPRGRDRPRTDRVRARAPVCRHLGAERRRARRRPDPARRGAAPTGVDRPDPGARRPRR